jgi:hypothetical protein
MNQFAIIPLKWEKYSHELFNKRRNKMSELSGHESVEQLLSKLETAKTPGLLEAILESLVLAVDSAFNKVDYVHSAKEIARKRFPLYILSIPQLRTDVLDKDMRELDEAIRKAFSTWDEQTNIVGTTIADYGLIRCASCQKDYIMFFT